MTSSHDEPIHPQGKLTQDSTMIATLGAQLRMAGYTRFEEYRPTGRYRVCYLRVDIKGPEHRFEGAGASVSEAEREAVTAYRQWVRSRRPTPRTS